jgi:hypothetical protein
MAAKKSIEVDLSAKRATNLAVLQRSDGNVLEIIGDATHVALYTFEPAQQGWERMNIEGACFITRSAVPPFYNLRVLNKLGPDDYALDMKCIMNIKVQAPYLMMRHSTAGAPCIVGLWFHNEAERDELKEIITRATTSAAAPPDPLHALKKLLTAPESVRTTSSATKSSSSSSASSSSSSSSSTLSSAVTLQPSSTTSAAAKLLSTLKGTPAAVQAASAAAAQANGFAQQATASAGVFLTDREIAAKHNNTKAPSASFPTISSSSPHITTTPSVPANGGGVDVLASKLKSLLKVETPQSAPPTPPAPTSIAQGQSIPVGALFAAAKVKQSSSPAPAPAPAPARVQLPEPKSLDTSTRAAPSPAAKLLSPSDLLGFKKSYN